jgi:DNA-binding transcriptional ArsR family regulator
MDNINEHEILGDDGVMDRLTQGLQGFGHPVRARCLVLLANEHSPTELTDILGGPKLGAVAYHVRMLRDYGLIEVTRQVQRRGALEHFYVRTLLAEDMLHALAPIFGLPRPRRRKPTALAA